LLTAYDRPMANARPLPPAGEVVIAVDLLTDVASDPLPGLIGASAEPRLRTLASSRSGGGSRAINAMAGHGAPPPGSLLCPARFE